MLFRSILIPEAQSEAEALICALTRIAHMKITASEYPWSNGEDYVHRDLRVYALRQQPEIGSFCFTGGPLSVPDRRMNEWQFLTDHSMKSNDCSVSGC